MVRKPPTRSSIRSSSCAAGRVRGVDVADIQLAAVPAFDQRTVAPPLDPDSAAAQIAAAFALLTWPGLQYAALVGIALWAFRRRLRQLAVALGADRRRSAGAARICSRSSSVGPSRHMPCTC